MNKNLIYVIIAVVVIVVVATFVFYKPSSMPGVYQTPGTSEASGTSGATPSPSSANGMTLKGLLSLGSSQKCTFVDATSPTASSEGTVYVAQGQLRGDFTSVVAGTTIKSHMIIVGNTSYTWTDAAKVGSKMALATIEQQQAPGPNQGFDPNKSVNYSCAYWPTDMNVFALPAGIQFSNMTNILPNPPTPKK